MIYEHPKDFEELYNRPIEDYLRNEFCLSIKRDKGFWEISMRGARHTNGHFVFYGKSSPYEIFVFYKQIEK